MPIEFLSFVEVVWKEKGARNLVWKGLASEFIFAFPEDLRLGEV
jgi:hypothetical protein